jgi:hypothetical protein
MALATTTILAAVAATTAVAGYVQGEESRKNASEQAGRAYSEQRKAQSEQVAGNAAQAAAERRRQVREERVRRSRILQSAQNSGTAGSSGETGALGSLATQLGANLGANAGAVQRGFNISEFSQKAADFSFQAQQSQSDAQSFNQLGSLGMSIFSAAGGFNAFGGSGSTPAPTTKQSIHSGGF